MPTRMTTALDYCLRLWIETPMYQAVVARVVGHFLTRLNFRGEIGSPTEREEFETFFTEELGGLMALRLMGLESFCYGTAFMRCHFPFARVLLDREHGYRQHSINSFPEELVEFDLETMTYLVPDPKHHAPYDQRRQIRLPFRDLPVKDFSKIAFRTLNPRYCRLRYSEISGETQVEYMFEPDTKSRVRAGSLFEVNRTPKDMLAAIRDKAAYLFHQNKVAILKEPTISGISCEGWGLPPLLSHFPAVHRIAVLDRIDDVVAKEYMLPRRIITPDLSNVAPGEGQVISGEWRPAVARMWEDQRRDPTKVGSFPFPVILQNLGGEGRNLMPKDLREVAVNNLFRGMGVPLDFYDSSLTMQQIPSAVRLFESSHMPMAHGLAKVSRWMTATVSSFMYGEPYDASLRKPSIADDIERRGLLFNLMSTRDIPASVAFDGLDLERPVDLKVEAYREQMEVERRLAVLQKEEELKSRNGSIDDVLNNAEQQQGGGGVSPVDVRRQAEDIATQWLSIPTDGERAKAMRQVASTDPQLYAYAKEMMEQIRAQGASQGRQQAAQQYQQ